MSNRLVREPLALRRRAGGPRHHGWPPVVVKPNQTRTHQQGEFPAAAPDVPVSGGWDLQSSGDRVYGGEGCTTTTEHLHHGELGKTDRGLSTHRVRRFPRAVEAPLRKRMRRRRVESRPMSLCSSCKSWKSCGVFLDAGHAN